MPTWKAISLVVLRLLEGLFLFFLVATAILWAAMCFSAAQFQVRIAELTISGTPLTIWRVDAYRDDIAGWSTEVREMRRKNDGLKIRRVSVERIIALNEPELKTRQDNLQAELELLRAKLPEKIRVNQPAGTSSGVALALLQAAAAQANDLDDGTKQRLEKLEDVNSAILEHKLFVDRQRSNLYVIRYDLDQAEIELKAKLTDISRVFGTLSENAAPEFIERLINTAAELEALKRVRFGYVYNIALFTNDMLVLFLVITMGALGSALSLVAEFIKGERINSLSAYAVHFVLILVRLAFGAVTAIVVFIIAKAGIPILADAAKLGGSTPVNPYFISFLAIVSGLVSDRALETVRMVASKVFQAGGDIDARDRYARVALDAALLAANRTIDQFAQALQLDPNAVRQLFSGRDLVSPERQKLAAAYFGQPVRDLFSDLPAT